MRASSNSVVLIIEKTSDKESNDLSSSPGFIMICVTSIQYLDSQISHLEK